MIFLLNVEIVFYCADYIFQTGSQQPKSIKAPKWVWQVEVEKVLFGQIGRIFVNSLTVQG